MNGYREIPHEIVTVLMLASLLSACSGTGVPLTPQLATATPQTATFDETTIKAVKLLSSLEVFVGSGTVMNNQGETLEITATGTSSDYLVEFFKAARFSFEVSGTSKPPSVNVNPIQTARFSVDDALKADKRNLLIQFDIPVSVKEKYPKGSISVVVDPLIGEKLQHIYLPTNPSTNQADVEVRSLQGAVQGDLYLRDVGLLDTRAITVQDPPQTLSGAGEGLFDFVVTGMGPGNSEYQFRGTWSYDLTEPATPVKSEISQTESDSSAWFGGGNKYVNVGQGQSFVLHQSAMIRQFSIYLVVYRVNPDGDKVICDLRDGNMKVLQESSSVIGLSSGEGWLPFDFNITVNPGTYIFTCYVSGNLEKLVNLETPSYGIYGNGDDSSYPEGTRYDSMGGHPEDGSTWRQEPWDLKFIVNMETLP